MTSLVFFVVVIAIIGSVITSTDRTFQSVLFVLIFMVFQAFLMSVFSSFGVLIIWIPSTGINFLVSEFKKLKSDLQKLNSSNSISQKLLRLIGFGVRLIYFPIIIALIIFVTAIVFFLFLVIYLAIFQEFLIPLLSNSAKFIGIDRIIIGVNRITGLDFLVMGISPLLIELVALSLAIVAKDKIIKRINSFIMPIILTSLIILGTSTGILAGIYFKTILATLTSSIDLFNNPGLTAITQGFKVNFWKDLIIFPLTPLMKLSLTLLMILSGTISIVLFFYLSLQQKRLLQHYKNIECGKIQR